MEKISSYLSSTFNCDVTMWRYPIYRVACALVTFFAFWAPGNK